MVKPSIAVGAFAAVILVIAPSKVMAQEDQDNLFVDHFTTATDQLYTFVNPCSFSLTKGTGPASCSEFDAGSYACANIYVYSNQDIVACGSCFVSPNGSREVDLQADLIAHPVTGVTPTSGVVKVVPTQFTSSFCDPTKLAVTGNFLAVFRAKASSELQLDGVNLSAAEKAKLQTDCSAVNDVLSGSFNVSCGASDPAKAPGVHDAQKKSKQ